MIYLVLECNAAQVIAASLAGLFARASGCNLVPFVGKGCVLAGSPANRAQSVERVQSSVCHDDLRTGLLPGEFTFHQGIRIKACA